MALVLLRFPDAPAAFRKGVLQTLKDEQEHTQLYLRRMKECGVHFGELPVSGYFWRSVSVMENPMDYVSSLCLTFEQANLDFARHFAQGFATVGDAATAKLLEKIYRDEIGHVAYGLKWFRRWKNPGESDWEAFCRQLKFPLSPQRAKGMTLNVEGRRAAGLDAQFIAELDVFSQSKGRTPNVFVFNPFAEAIIAHGKSFNPTKHQAQLARDLENLPAISLPAGRHRFGERKTVSGILERHQAGRFCAAGICGVGSARQPWLNASSAVCVRGLGDRTAWNYSSRFSPISPARNAPRTEVLIQILHNFTRKRGAQYC